MAEKVQFEVEVITKGRADLDKVHDSMQKVDQQDRQFTKNIVDQRNGLKELNPLINQMGLGFLGSATMMGVAVGGLAMLTKSVVDFYSAQKVAADQYANFNNIVGGGNINLDLTTAKLAQLQAYMGQSQGDISKAYGMAISATQDPAGAMSLITKAGEIAIRNNQKLTDVAQTLSSAYANGINIGGRQYQPGEMALQAAESKLSAEGTPITQSLGQMRGALTSTGIPDWLTNLAMWPVQAAGQTIQVFIGNEMVHSSTLSELNTQTKLRGGGD